MLIKCIKELDKRFTIHRQYEATVKDSFLVAIDNQGLTYTVAYNQDKDWDKDPFFKEHFKIVG